MSKEKPYHEPTEAERVEAKALHRHTLEVRLKKDEERLEKKHKLEDAERKAHFEFLNRVFTEEDRHHVTELTGAAVHAGEFEVEILRFPASYLTDGGRAINNADPNWPDSLTGYAASMYAAYADISKPLGYKLVARVLDYPNGMIGEIGFYLEW
jgi:hypothetical protein